MSTAVQLYARATGYGQSRGERGPISIAAELTPEQLKDHELLLVVRHRAIAHVYANEIIGAHAWNSDAVLIVEDGWGWVPMIISQRKHLQDEVLHALARQVPVADEILTRRFHEHLNKAVDLLNHSPVAIAVIERNLVDPKVVCGSEETARLMLARRGDGRVTIYERSP